MICPFCNTEYDDTDEFCPSCDAPNPEVAEQADADEMEWGFHEDDEQAETEEGLAEGDDDEDGF